MSTKKELKLLTELLNLEGVNVYSHRQYEGIGIILQIEAIDRESICGRCGLKSNKIHQNRRHIIKDLSWGEEVLGDIEEVSIDLWKGYKSLVTEIMPKAQVVADRFHVMVQINKELDMQRKKEKRIIEQKIKQAKTEKEKLEGTGILAGIIASKYALLKNEKDLNQEQKDKLAEVKVVSQSLKLMHQLQEKFREIFEKPQQWSEALLELGEWLSTAQNIL